MRLLDIQPEAIPAPINFKAPPKGTVKHAMVRCAGFDCRAYLDSDGKWRESKFDLVISAQEVIHWF